MSLDSGIVWTAPLAPEVAAMQYICYWEGAQLGKVYHRCQWIQILEQQLKRYKICSFYCIIAEKYTALSCTVLIVYMPTYVAMYIDIVS